MEDNLSNLKVMMIDDSNTIRRTAEALLKKTGCTVFTAEDGFDALGKISKVCPDIIFVDVMMPRLNGYETCSIIRSNRQFEHIPIILLSSKSSFCDKARGEVVGANSYLTKPFTRDELLTAINKYVQLNDADKAVA